MSQVCACPVLVAQSCDYAGSNSISGSKKTQVYNLPSLHLLHLPPDLRKFNCMTNHEAEDWPPVFELLNCCCTSICNTMTTCSITKYCMLCSQYISIALAHYLIFHDCRQGCDHKNDGSFAVRGTADHGQREERRSKNSFRSQWARLQIHLGRAIRLQPPSAVLP